HLSTLASHHPSRLHVFSYHSTAPTAIYSLSLHDALPILSTAGVSYEFHVSSAHRQPDQTADLVKGARKKGFRVVIAGAGLSAALDRKSTRLNSSHVSISYAVFCLKKKNNYDAVIALNQVK